eukprot:m.129505 g.129505  ORF g.129505 m.129505 type:complete len:173 (-) comp52315_c0_seq6:148-666(-)
MARWRHRTAARTAEEKCTVLEGIGRWNAAQGRRWYRVSGAIRVARYHRLGHSTRPKSVSAWAITWATEKPQHNLQENERVVITLTISRCGGCSPLEIGLDVKAGFLSRGRWAREAEVKREWVVGDVAAAAFAMRLASSQRRRCPVGKCLAQSERRIGAIDLGGYAQLAASGH